MLTISNLEFTSSSGSIFVDNSAAPLALALKVEDNAALRASDIASSYNKNNSCVRKLSSIHRNQTLRYIPILRDLVRH